MTQAQELHEHRQDVLRKEMQKAKQAHTGRHASAKIKDIACRAVRNGLSITQVVQATGYSPAALRRWVAQSSADKGHATKNTAPQVQVLQITKPPDKVEIHDAPLASLEFGTFTLRLFMR